MSDKDLLVNTQVKASGFNHSFDVGIATLCGVDAACVYNNLVYWLIHNKIHGKNFYKGRTWSYNTPEAMAQYLPYLNSRQIRYALQKLLDKGIIIKDNFNKNKLDRTSWYALNDESPLKYSKNIYDLPKLSNASEETIAVDDEKIQKNKCILQNCQMDLTNLADPLYTDTIPTNTDNTSLMVPDKPADAGAAVAAVGVLDNPKPKRERTPSVFSPKVKEVADKMLNILVTHNPVYRPPDNMQKFLEQVQLMIEKDKQDIDVLLKTFEWACSDNEERDKFKGWQGVICSNNSKGKPSNPIEKFRKHYSSIWSQMNSQPKRKFAPSSNDQRAIEIMEDMARRAL